MEGNLFGKDIDDLSKKLLKQKKLYLIKWLCDNKNWDNLKPEIVYFQSGSFARYLINNYGLEKFKKVYKKTSRKKTPKENIKIIENICSKSIKEIEEDWKKYLEHKK